MTIEIFDKLCHHPDGCDNPSFSKGYCRMHYKRLKRTGDLGPVGRIVVGYENTVCRHPDGCPNLAMTKGYCSLHYSRFNATGDPGPVGRIKPAQGDGSWVLNAAGYLFRKVTVTGEGRKTIFQHRFVMEEFLGRKLQDNETIHHKNGDRNDNRIENLELWSSFQPTGQRIKDKLDWAHQIINQYEVSVALELSVLI